MQEIMKLINQAINQHMTENGHSFDLTSLNLIHRVDKFYELNAYESFYINHNNNKNLMNENNGPIANSIFTKFYV